jgi:hypothetical protein
LRRQPEFARIPSSAGTDWSSSLCMYRLYCCFQLWWYLLNMDHSGPSH